ncbi:MAG: restriction endonuclease subunit S [Bacteroidales bacterium]|nr:restriction endonuclease subunit S [Bacteroidales bacterium]
MTGKQLKDSILQWAIQGKLVSQDPSDEPAKILLERIRKEKNRLIKEKKIKKPKTDSVIYRDTDGSFYEKLSDGKVNCIDDEIPFEIPESWEWVRLSSIASIMGGKRIPAGKKLITTDTGHIYIRVADMKNESVNTDDLHYISDEIYEKIKRYTISKDDIYITVAGTIGNVGTIPETLDGANLTENADKIVFSLISKEYLLRVLQSPTVQIQIRNAITKVGQPKLAILRIEQFIIPIAPLNEQHRIIKKLNKSLQLADFYDAQQKQIIDLNANIKTQLKKSILQEAIQGKLVPQDPNDEPAAVLLHRIKTEKQRLVKNKKNKTDKNESSIFKAPDGSFYEKLTDGSTTCIDDQIPFDIPDTWQWVRLGSCITLLSGQDLDPSRYNSEGEGIPYMTGASNFVGDELVVNRWTETPVSVSKKGSLLITCKGTIGAMAFNNIGDIHIARQIMAIESLGAIDLRYIRYFLEANIKAIEKKAKSMIPGISREVLLNEMTPIPPLEEQARIVNKIEQAMATIDTLQ